jgi:hypothetical protein
MRKMTEAQLAQRKINDEGIDNLFEDIGYFVGLGASVVFGGFVVCYLVVGSGAVISVEVTKMGTKALFDKCCNR